MFQNARPTVVLKQKTLDTVTTISATETDTTVWDLRGATDITFEFLSTLNTGFMTGSVFFIGSILTCGTPNGTFAAALGCDTAELVVNVKQILPTLANAPALTLQRYVAVKWTETGAMTSFTGSCKMNYNRLANSPGPGVDHAAIS